MFLTKKRGLATPLPEALDGEPWEIRDVEKRQAGVAPEKHYMQVPLGTDVVDRLIRLHEMMHVKIKSPQMDAPDLSELPEDVLQLCEDSRVHGHLKRLGFDTRPLKDVISDHEMDHMGKKSHPAQLAALAAAMHNTGETQRLYAAIGDNKERQTIYQYGNELAYHRMHKPDELPSFDHVVQMVGDIVNVFGSPDDPPPPDPPKQQGNQPNNAPRQPPLPVSEKWLRQMARKPRSAPQTAAERQQGIPNPSTAMWATMTVETPALPLRMPSKMRGRRRKVPEVRGRRLHRVGRLYQDGRVFADKPPTKGGGAVLIDTSGSMKLETNDVLLLMQKYPAGIIAAYSALGADDYGNNQGTLRVIAKNGRRVPDQLVNPPGGDNGVDGPALDWLAKQPGPRYWISDGQTSGGTEGRFYCFEVCRKKNITRVANAWELVGKV